MNYVIEHTHIIDHERFLEAGPHARDLWEWGMKYSGKHETDGEIPMTAVLASPWGYGGKANIKAASRLVEVGLWERTDRGFRIRKWTDMGNKTKAELEAAREADRVKKRNQRRQSQPPPPGECPPPCPSGTPQGTPEGTPLGVLNSTSYSPSSSGSGSREGVQGEGPPPWFEQAAETAAMAVGGNVGELPARWASYRASRGRKGWAKNHEDAVGWLCDVVRGERAKAVTRPGRADTRQPLHDPASATWLKTGTEHDL